MSTPNSSSSGPEKGVEKEAKSTKKGLVHSLVKSAVEKEFGSSQMDPKRFNAYLKNRDTIYESIRTEISVIQDDDRENYGDLTEKEIIEASGNTELAAVIANHAKKLILLRERSLSHAKELIPQDVQERNPEWETLLKEHIFDLKENQLELLVLQKAKMRNLLRRLYPELKNPELDERVAFDRIFSDYEKVATESGDKERMQKIIKEQVLFGQNPGSDDVDFILGVYRNAGTDRQIELLKQLSVLISIKLAVKYGLVEKNFTEKFAQREYADLYNDLSTEKKEIFLRGLERLNLQVLRPSELDTNKIGTIFQDKNARDELTQEVFRSTSLTHEDAEEKRKRLAENDIMLNIAEEKRIKRDKDLEAGLDPEEEDYNMYDAFVEKLMQMRRNNGQPLVENIENLRNENCILEINHPTDGKIYMRFELGEERQPVEVRNHDGSKFGYGVRLIEMPVKNAQLKREKDLGGVNFQDFLNILKNNDGIRVIQKADFENNILTTDINKHGQDGLIYDARNIDEKKIDSASIKEKLDLLDPAGHEYGFSPGTAFIAPSQDSQSGKSESDDIWEVVSISDDKIILRDSRGTIVEPNMDLDEVYYFLESTGTFRRVGKIENEDTLLKNLQDYKLSGDARLKNGQLTVTKDDHGKEKEKIISCFASKKGGHIRLESIKDGVVSFGEFDDSGEDIEKIKKYAENKGVDETVESYYKWQRMSYSAFLAYAEKNELEATTDQLIKEPALHDLGHHDEHYHAHMEGSLLKRIMKWQNPASIIKGFEMLYHGIEHTLEKGAKLDAARFAMNTSKFLNLPDGVSAQIYADITSASKEILEKYEQKIFGLPGPRGREKCIHIVHNKDSRPEEVMSAINYMLKSYGHLYAEDIKHYQSKVSKDSVAKAPAGYFAFFDAFVLTGKLGGDLVTWRQKAYDRAITEMGEKDNHEGEPTEEQMIHALLKTIDGNWDKYLYAASVMKANGGPSGFEKTWKFEGYDNAYKKGKDQSQMVNAQGRLNKAISFLGTHEIYKAIGAMEMMAAKVKAPEYQAIPFVWAVGGYSGHASHAALQKLKAYAENGLSFHAFGFLRNKSDNMLYRKTVIIALKDLIEDGSIPAGALSEFESICDRFDHGPEDAKVTEKKYNKVHPPMAMMKFWQKYQGRGLNDMLQGQNGWLINKSKSDPTVLAYMGSIRDPQAAHGMQLKDPKIPSEPYAQDWFNEHGYMNMILAKDDGKYGEQYKGMMSLHSMLNKIVFKGTASSGGRPMNDEHYEKIWFYIKRYMTSNGGLRDKRFFKGNPDLQKQQYLAHREQILGYLRQELNTMIDRPGETLENRRKIIEKVIATYPYYNDLSEMGISPEAVFDKDFADSQKDNDYSNWTRGLRSGGSIRSSTSSVDLAALVSGKAHRATAPTSRRASAPEPIPIDTDTKYGGGAASTDEDGSGV